MALVARIIRLASLAVSLIVILGFALFAQEQAGAATEGQIQKVERTQGVNPLPTSEMQRERRNSLLREWIDDANDVLLSPFAPLVAGREIWFQRVVAGMLALLLYGFLATVLANYLRK